MMHFDQYVVAITDQNGKSYREFESEKLYKGRKSKVHLPYDSEYKILVKNNSDRRIKLDIDIDGTNVTRNGLIMGPGETDSIERFVEVAKKFKFVRKTDSRVSDPTNVDNGFLKVLISREVAPKPDLTEWMKYICPIVQSQPCTWKTTEPYIGTPNPFPGSETICNDAIGNGSSISDYSSVLRGMNCVPTSYKCSIDAQVTTDWMREEKCLGDTQHVMNFCSYKSIAPKKPVVKEEVGATVEGSHSAQVFSTTNWEGTEGIAYEFIFKLLAQGGVSDEERIEYQKYLELKKKFEK